MITQIKNISNCGIFKNYTPKGLDHFTRFNLIYGWNGSGKSTLAKILRHIENKEAVPHLDSLTYQIEISGKLITETTNAIEETVRVYNSDFVNKHLSFESGDARSIVYIGNEKVELKQKIDAKEAEIKRSTQSNTEINKKLSRLRDDRNKWFSAVGSDLSRFHSATVFSAEAKNINKIHAEDIWKTINHGDSLGDVVLGDRKFNELYSFIQQSNSRRKFPKILEIVDQEYLNNAYQKYQELLRTNPVINTIQRLAANPPIQEWVQRGLKLHQEHASLKCEYCKQDIPASRQKELENHFNEQFQELQREIQLFISELKSKHVREVEYPLAELPNAHEHNFNFHYGVYLDSINSLNSGLTTWIEKLEYKLANPLQIHFSTSNIAAHGFEISKEWINGFTEWHNKNIDDFEDVSRTYRRQIDQHIVASKAIEDRFISLEQDIIVTSEERERIETDFRRLKENLRELQTELEDDTIVIEEFNHDLHRFTQRNEITLTKRSDGGGYSLERGGAPARNLSEGEKSAIGLVYFIKKLSEGSHNIENTIVILDDPISSFDSNHLFAASSYIMTNCKRAKQVFILTHSFWFFKLIRDWYVKRYKGNYALFTLTRAGLNKAEAALANHHSEYHYVFSNIKKWAESQEIIWQDNFSIANQCRRLLESFSAFKTPSKDGFNGILQLAENRGFSLDVINKLTFFLNKYSHLDRIEAHENAIENIQGEGKSVAVETLRLLEFIDKEHYDAMTKLCTDD